MKKIVISLFLALCFLYVLCMVHKTPAPARRFARRLQGNNRVDSVCKGTLYPHVCLSTLHARPPQGVSIKDMATVSLQASLQELQKLYSMVALENEEDVIEDCGTLFQSSLRHLNGSLELVRKPGDELKREEADDVKTWLSASLTDLETCKEPFQELNTRVAKLVSNSLAIVNSIPVPVGSIHRRRLLSEPLFSLEDGFPSWISPADRRLLQSSPAGGVAANVVVAKDGSGNYKTVSEAVESAPSNGNGRYVIHVKAGVYAERVLVSKDNIMLIGDGKDVTVVSGSKSGASLKSIPTFAVTGKGFIARDIGFENTAGADQAIALRAASDQSVYYRCSLKSYQDTLYAYSLRQFYRECDIYGSVDFIFGNAAAVFQSCNIISRQRGGGSANYITAQGRTDPNQNTGFSIDECKVTGSMRTYLGRPWKQYSRTVFMQSYLDGSIDPAGWADWPGSSFSKSVYYGEYMNNGPGAGTSKRVQWLGYHIISTTAEASKFTVAELISGNSWLPSTGVSFRSGLIS